MYLPIDEFEKYVSTVDGTDLDFEMNGIVLTLQDVRVLDGRAILYRDEHGNQARNGVTSSPMAMHLSNPYQLRRPGEALEFVTQLSINEPLPSHIEGRIMLMPDLLRSGFVPPIYPIPVGYEGLIRFPVAPMMRAVLEKGIDVAILRFMDVGLVPEKPKSTAKKGKKSATNSSGSKDTVEDGERDSDTVPDDGE